jgi:hypothetical protein
MRHLTISLAVGLLACTLASPVWARPTPPERETTLQRLMALGRITFATEMRRLTAELARLQQALKASEQALEHAQQRYWKLLLDEPPICPVPHEASGAVSVINALPPVPFAP